MISIALALVLSQAVVPGLRGRVCHDDLGEGNLCGWGYVQTPSVVCTAYANSRTNLALYSEQLDNGAWVKYSVSVAVPTVTPDALGTAERMQIAATVGGQASLIYQGTATATPNSSFTMYVQGNGMSGTTDICSRTAALTYTCVPCVYSAGVLSRCSISLAADANQLLFGNAGAFNGSVARGAADVFAYKAQLEASLVPTPYIGPTLGTAGIAPPGCY